MIKAINASFPGNELFLTVGSYEDIPSYDPSRVFDTRIETYTQGAYLLGDMFQTIQVMEPDFGGNSIAVLSYINGIVTDIQCCNPYWLVHWEYDFWKPNFLESLIGLKEEDVRHNCRTYYDGLDFSPRRPFIKISTIG